MIKVLRTTGKTLLLILEIIFLILVCYFSYLLSGMLIPSNTDYQYSEKEIQFFVITNGVHTDVCLPVVSSIHDWSNFIPMDEFNGIVGKPKYISIGWGDKGFYLDTPTWADLKFSTAVNAVFLPSETAMHITYVQDEPKVSERVVKCSMDEKEYYDLIQYILGSFDMKGAGLSIQLIKGKGYTSMDNFYEANGSYYGFKTCNTWTNEALKIAGIKTSFHALLEVGVMRWIH
ncbi:MAG: TIGR02117 family protein [Flavobacteriales bacterium]|nr:TIGR02117 family protein [Flavobacteriales bacterium]MCB9197468.1 TIGR02117 family protein [Flavobacteriales bacterium]